MEFCQSKKVGTLIVNVISTLCFQAALILFGQNQGNTDFQNDNFCNEVSKMLPELLVTAPNEKRKVSM